MKYAVCLTLFGLSLLLLCLTLPPNGFVGRNETILNFSEKAPKKTHQASPALAWRSDYANMPISVYQNIAQNALRLRDSVACANNALLWESIGPNNIGGRITDIEMPLHDLQNIFVGTASGGVWHSADFGRSWLPIFDNQPTLSIGDLAIAPTNPHRIFVGTGEPNGGGGSITYDGLGIFCSNDNGKNWYNIGLENSGSISRIIVSPDDENTIFVGAMGRLFANNTERGVFMTHNGGKTWQQVLYVSDSTGCSDLAFHQQNPNIIYAAMWERVRRPDYKRYGGPSGGLYRSKDGGKTWQKLTQGLPTTYLGRIGLAVSPQKPDRVYAIYADEQGIYRGLFVSHNSGDTWQEVPGKSLFDSFRNYGWWFGRIAADPNNANHLFIMGVDLYESNDGGSKWENITLREKVHCDQHALFIPPQNSKIILLGNDGGLYKSLHSGKQWEHIPLPISQFYTCTVVPTNAGESLYGGTQDNGIIGWIKDSFWGSNNWLSLSDGDGFDVIANPKNKQEMLMTLQYGEVYKSKNGGFSWEEAGFGLSLNERHNWHTPIMPNPQNPNMVYYAAEKLYRFKWGEDSWKRVNPDPLLPSFSPNAPKEHEYYGAASAMSIAPSDSNYIYIGTNNGQLLRSTDNGHLFKDIGNNLPKKWISAIAVSTDNPQQVIVAFSGYRHNEKSPYLYLSRNGGQTWEAIGNNLPASPINCLAIHPNNPQLIFVGTDVGVFVSDKQGKQWRMAGIGMPIVPVTALTFGQNGKQLIAATFGRSIYNTSIEKLLTPDSNNKAKPKP